MNRVEADEVLSHQFFNPPSSVIDEKIEQIDRGSDLEFLFQRVLPGTTASFYDFDAKRGHRASNFAIGTAGV